MEYLVNAQEMKQYDGDTVRRIGIPSLVLMERAALSVAEEMEKSIPPGPVLVVCGSGNNGGDGFALARLLKERGFLVEAAFVGRTESLSPECRIQRQISENCGVKMCSSLRDGEYTTIVDALFGTGLSREVEGEYADLIHWINRQDAFRVAVDLPSGLNADTGDVMGIAVWADLTVTFAFRKLGQVLYPGADYCGRLVCRDIGITTKASQSLPKVFTYTRKDLSRLPRRAAYSNKGTFGKVLLVAGSEGMAGAACLCGRAAYRAGCGLVRVFTPECNRCVLQTVLPEAMVTAYAGEEEALALLPGLLAWADVVGIGPGIGSGGVSLSVLKGVLEDWNGPLVADADALNLISAHRELLKPEGAEGRELILTPHVGEMMRFTGRTKEEITEDLLKSARDTAREHRLTCVLKDARTVVSDGEWTYVNTAGCSGMATGGSGDVLTGVVCALLAQGMAPFEAAAMGVYLHSLAGEAVSRERSEYGVMAGEIADAVAGVLRQAEKGGRQE